MEQLGSGYRRLFGYNKDNDDMRAIMTSPVSLRLSSSLDRKVRTLAQLEHRSISDTVNMLTEEAIKIREFPDITFVDGPAGRRAAFRKGPDVWQVLEPYTLSGCDWEVLWQSYSHLGEALLRTALRYYEAYPDEIDARIRLNQEMRD